MPGSRERVVNVVSDHSKERGECLLSLLQIRV